MKYLLLFSAIALSNIIFAQDSSPGIMLNESESQMFKKKLNLQTIDFDTDWKVKTNPEFKLVYPEAIAKGGWSIYLNEMPIHKPESIDNMPQLQPTMQSLMPIIKPSNGKYVLIGNSDNQN